MYARVILRPRVKAGMERAWREGKQIGRPSVWDRRGFPRRFDAILERINEGPKQLPALRHP